MRWQTPRLRRTGRSNQIPERLQSQAAMSGPAVVCCAAASSSKKVDANGRYSDINDVQEIPCDTSRRVMGPASESLVSKRFLEQIMSERSGVRL